MIGHDDDVQGAAGREWADALPDTRTVNGRVYTVTYLPPAGATSACVIGNLTRSRVTSGRCSLTLG